MTFAKDTGPNVRSAVDIQYSNNLVRSLVTQTNGESYPRNLSPIKQKDTAINLLFKFNSTPLSRAWSACV